MPNSFTDVNKLMFVDIKNVTVSVKDLNFNIKSNIDENQFNLVMALILVIQYSSYFIHLFCDYKGITTNLSICIRNFH